MSTLLVPVQSVVRLKRTDRTSWENRSIINKRGTHPEHRRAAVTHVIFTRTKLWWLRGDYRRQTWKDNRSRRVRVSHPIKRIYDYTYINECIPTRIPRAVKDPAFVQAQFISMQRIATQHSVDYSDSSFTRINTRDDAASKAHRVSRVTYRRFSRVTQSYIVHTHCIRTYVRVYTLKILTRGKSMTHNATQRCGPHRQSKRGLLHTHARFTRARIRGNGQKEIRLAALCLARLIARAPAIFKINKIRAREILESRAISKCAIAIAENNRKNRNAQCLSHTWEKRTPRFSHVPRRREHERLGCCVFFFLYALHREFDCAENILNPRYLISNQY